MSIGEYIREARSKRGLMAKWVAAKAGVAPETLSRWETGARVPSAEGVVRVSRALGLSDAELLEALRLRGEP